MKSLPELTKEAEDYFSRIAIHKEQIAQSYQHIISTMDDALSRRDTAALLELIPYIETGDGQFAFQHIGKSHRILRILQIIKLELGFHQLPFSEGCTSFDELWEKYSLTLFALRRLTFCLSEDSVTEAVYFLQNQPISYLAAYIMAQNELLVPNPAFYEMLVEIYHHIWTDVDIGQFYALIQSA